MRPWIVRLSSVIVLVTGTSLAIAFSNGPPASRTGAPAIGGVPAEQSCTDCHGGTPLNSPGATLEILDIPQSYVADSIYTFRVRMTSTFNPPRRWGFELTAVREANGQGAGQFTVTGTTGVQLLPGTGVYSSRWYVQHNLAGSYATNPGPVEWSIRWLSPSVNVGRIFFFAAGNAANNNNGSSGDRIYTQQAFTDFSTPLDVPAGPIATLDQLEPARPNPFHTHSVLNFTLAQGGPVNLSVFDAQGRRVRTLVAGDRPAGRGSASWDGRMDDGTLVRSGVYFVRLTLPGGESPISRRVVFTP
jgi:FlgD Ig-like domain